MSNSETSAAPSDVSLKLYSLIYKLVSVKHTENDVRKMYKITLNRVKKISEFTPIHKLTYLP